MSQQLKEQSRIINRSINNFESPTKKPFEGLHDVSPIPHRDEAV
jgi:hypothetical protein